MEQQLVDSAASFGTPPVNHLSLQGHARRMIAHWAHLARIRKGTVRGGGPMREQITLLPPALRELHSSERGALLSPCHVAQGRSSEIQLHFQPSDLREHTLAFDELYLLKRLFAFARSRPVPAMLLPRREVQSRQYISRKFPEYVVERFSSNGPTEGRGRVMKVSITLLIVSQAERSCSRIP